MAFCTGDEEVKSIRVLNPFKNWGAVFTGFGIVTTLVIVLIICLITKKVPPEHPAKYPHGLFLKAKENLWGDIGYLDGVADSLNSIRGFHMSAQIVVQSLSQWQEKYPGREWENQLATFDQTLYMGCNDLTSAKYISEKCGKVTISVLNNQMR